jgi:DNA invertase Pin-like site-specific DNA recombinase
MGRAEFERALIRERTRAGLETAWAQGRKGGRKPVLNAEQKADIADNVLSGRITQGTRGLKGQQWCERFWTI